MRCINNAAARGVKLGIFLDWNLMSLVLLGLSPRYRGFSHCEYSVRHRHRGWAGEQGLVP